MSGLEWVGLALIGGFVFLMTTQAIVGVRAGNLSARKAVGEANRAHELRLAELESDMYLAALAKPPTNVFQARGRAIPDLLGRSSFGRRPAGLGETFARGGTGSWESRTETTTETFVPPFDQDAPTDEPEAPEVAE